MKSSFDGLRATLVLVLCVNALATYILIAKPGMLLRFYPDVATLDTMHVYLSIGMGIFMLAFAVGALLAIVHPLKYVGIVSMLILMHFFGFVTDVIILAQGSVIPLKYLVPEMIYFLFICTLLVRFYPTADKSAEISETANELVDAFQDQLKKKTKQEHIAKQKDEQERERIKKELKKELKKEESGA